MQFGAVTKPLDVNKPWKKEVKQEADETNVCNFVNGTACSDWMIWVPLKLILYKPSGQWYQQDIDVVYL